MSLEQIKFPIQRCQKLLLVQLTSDVMAIFMITMNLWQAIQIWIVGFVVLFQ